MLLSVSINTFKFNSDVKIIRQQRKIANGEIILKINEQRTHIYLNFNENFNIWTYFVNRWFKEK